MTCRCNGVQREPCGPDCVNNRAFNKIAAGLMDAIALVYDRALDEPVPDDMKELLAKLK